MTRKLIFIAILSITFLNCDSDFDQGSCDEGYFEQNNFEGGFHCVPISEKGFVGDSLPNADNL